MKKALVITGEGLNCESETAHALKRAGADAEIKHIRDLIDQPESLQNYRILAICGGFSYGDHLGAGTALALQLQLNLSNELRQFVDEGKPLIGICNGFQVLLKLGLLEDYNPIDASLTWNEEGKFINRWIKVSASPSNCLWTRNLTQFDLPIRNGEGRFYSLNKDQIEQLRLNQQVALEYVDQNPTGSHGMIAGLCNIRGNVLGLMPHPEAAVYNWQVPMWRLNGLDPKGQGPGLQMFMNAVEAA